MNAVLGLLALLILVCLPLAYVWLQARLLRRWTGPWRIAVGTPLSGWAIWIVTFVRDVGHSLLPLEILDVAGSRRSLSRNTCPGAPHRRGARPFNYTQGLGSLQVPARSWFAANRGDHHARPFEPPP